MLLVTRDQMREMDRRTIHDVGISGLVLMERAALGATDALVTHFDELFAEGSVARVGFLCGAGNNGGDGFVMARLLHELGTRVWVGTLRAPAQYTGDARTNLDVLEHIDVDVRDLSDYGVDELAAVLELLEPFDVWVDALFGTGLDREIEGTYRSAIDFLRSQPRVFALDIPSGIHADTGEVLGSAVRASATAAFGHIKLGEAIYPGRRHCGVIYPVDIGIPAKVTQEVGWEGELLLGDFWVPQRDPTMHKGDAGRIACIGGAPNTLGAILMTAHGALRSGAGLLKVGTYDECVAHVAPTIQEAMAVSVVAQTLEQRHADALEELLAWADVIAIGPGLGRHEGALEVLELALGAERPVVLDADGLMLLWEHRMKLRHRSVENLVLTPHPGEAAIMLGWPPESVVGDPVGSARMLADEWDAIAVLKGASTVVAYEDRLAVNTSGNPGMATGGMGDALTGIIAAQLAEGGEPFDAVCNAVWVHGHAADVAVETTGQRALTVTALLDALPGVWRMLEDA